MSNRAARGAGAGQLDEVCSRHGSQQQWAQEDWFCLGHMEFTMLANGQRTLQPLYLASPQLSRKTAFPGANEGRSGKRILVNQMTLIRTGRRAEQAAKSGSASLMGYTSIHSFFFFLVLTWIN